ncbi:MAG: GNAT family N-acetyltransferase [Thermoguttaceae bacterium]|nr:GNAT family N-acetyltransferase [Thermoguttaceae bacterium]
MSENHSVLFCVGKTSESTDGSLRLRWLCRRDFGALLALERAAFEFPWTRDEFEYCLRTRNFGGLVVERDGEPLGYLCFEARKRSFRLLSCAVADSERRRGVGTALVRALTERLDARRAKIVCVVRERKLAAQLFLRSLGFRAVWVARDYYFKTNEDAYRMTYRADVAVANEGADRTRRRLLSR